MSESSSFSLTRFVRLLYTQNPFYLIGTFLILLGLQQSLGQEPLLATSGLLTSLLAGYTVLLVLIGVVIVRWGQLWDDVRTILLVVVLLFYMLSTSLDVHVLESPSRGTALLLCGLAFCLGLSEFLLRILRLQLPAPYRWAFYLSLCLLFSYPIALAWLSDYRCYEARSWVIGSFALAASLPLLALIPAARSRTAVPVPCAATWQWPFYPWSLFVYLTVGLGLRAWWLTISFDPTKGEGNSFHPYLLIPLLLVWSLILLEAGLVHHRRYFLAGGLLLPAAAILLGYWGPGSSSAEAAFLARVTNTLGSPPQLAVWSVLAFQAWAYWRTASGPWNLASEVALTSTAILACMTGKHTLDWQTLTDANPSGIALVAAAFMANAMRQQSSYRALVAALLGGCYLWLTDIAKFPADPDRFWLMHAPVLVILALLSVFRDQLAALLRNFAVSAIPTLACVAALAYPWCFTRTPLLQFTVYLCFLLLVSFRLWLLDRQVSQLFAFGLTGMVSCLLYLWPAGKMLAESWLAAGLPYLLVGLAVVVAGIAVSLLKMKLPEHLWNWLTQFNEQFQLHPDEMG
ncbi:hypothetical protein ETAA8_29130 [Anatilimnocola aggregata]|uniref:DUF2157 domain-containing protein n=1 Tax=Anatilimnocola aggregata TaxID=2528021 RepID=A0A517YCG9_9BACT|nr:hypothetical protein [Anatilimnocola aggregata]QDU27822.1 hypothetical protein ETAA8_29130 [Anatilimnocola aggregata]